MKLLSCGIRFAAHWLTFRPAKYAIVFFLFFTFFLIFAGAAYAQDDCQATCRSSDSPCTGLVGDKFRQCVNQCVQACGKHHDPPPPDPLDPGCRNRNITGIIHCTINQPPVKAHETVIPNVVFAPGDIVDVTADGCVQTGGIGNTWKRYVNPSGPNSAQYYHGLIRIPTGTKDGALVRINTVIGKRLTVTGTGVPLDQLVLYLGYEDEGGGAYSDNGYYSHDDGTEDQCKSDSARHIDGGPVHVTLTIARQVTAPPPPDSQPAGWRLGTHPVFTAFRSSDRL